MTTTFANKISKKILCSALITTTMILGANIVFAQETQNTESAIKNEDSSTSEKKRSEQKKFKTKAHFTLGSSIVSDEQILGIADDEQDDNLKFAGLYALADAQLTTNYITIGGKIYYRLSEAKTAQELGQKLEIKRAYIKYRPLGNSTLEIAGGKLYSEYLAGNFFQLSETYTGATRWGKTGVGLKSNLSGFSFGAALALSESYEKFCEEFGLTAMFGYDFSNLENGIPLKLGSTFFFTREGDITSTESPTYDYSGAISLNYEPKLQGFVSGFSATASFSYNAEPYVASSVFKNVSNYKNADLKKAYLASVNFKSDFGKVGTVLEAEAGHSISGSMIPLYGGLQLEIPLYEADKTKLEFRPRFFYYGAHDSSDATKSRRTAECYPRLYFTSGNWIVSLGYDFAFKQIGAKGTRSDWQFEWNVPVYVEYKL
ncbi:MAG: hypothetical protein K6G52_00760 [Treponemataceae bacterium]|nr:hypothetical protein [Treponemataceae bacterium]